MAGPEVAGEHGLPPLARRAVGGRELTPFVNRTEERRLLVSRFEQVCEGDGQVVLLAGEAGIGKSRLLQVLREDISGTPHTWLQTSCAPAFVDTPLHPWTELLRQLLGWDAAGPPVARTEELAAALRRAGLDPQRALPHVAPQLGVPIPEGYPPQLAPPEVARKRLLVTLTAWVLGAARQQPMVILLEDLHWADPSTLELQQLMVEQGATDPLLLLHTARPQFLVPWPERAHHTQLTVNRLLKRHVRDMVMGVAARAVLLAEVIEQLAARTDGVPLFVEELTKAVIEAGAEAAAREIPATLVESLRARLDRLGAVAKEVAQVGAVCGREFRYRLLAAVHPIEGDELDRALQQLVEAELLYVRGFLPETTYTFKHGLVQDVAYASLDGSRRRALHGLVAAVLQRQDPALAEEHPELLAQHHSAAGEIEAAVAAWQRAGERMLQRGALSEGERHLRRGLDLLAALGEGPGRDARELQLQLALGRVLLLTRGYGAPETVAAYARARQVGERVADRDQLGALLNGTWILALMRQGPVAARPLADELMKAAEESGSPWWLGLGHLAQSVTRFHGGEFASAYEHAQLARAHSRTAPPFPVPVDVSIMALGYGAYAAWHLGLIEEACALVAETAARAEASGRPSDKGLAYQFRALFHGVMLWDLKAAETDVQRLLAACTEQPNPIQEAYGKMIQGWLLAVQGQPESGLAMMRPALEVYLSTGQRLGLGFFLGLLVEVYTLAGQTAEALDVLDESESASLGEEYLRPMQLCRRAELRDRAGAADTDVDATYREALARAHTLQTKGHALRIAVSYARWLRDHDRTAEAKDLLVPFGSPVSEGADTHDLRRARAALAELDALPPRAASLGEVLAAPPL